MRKSSAPWSANILSLMAHGFERAMPVQVVGTDVQDHGYPAVEALRGFQLKAGNLKHRPADLRYSGRPRR